MKRFSVLSEQDVLKILEIPDFRHLSKDKVMSFASMLPCMDPETAMKAIEQFPHYAEAFKEALGDFKEVVSTSLKSNDESMRQYYLVAQNNIAVLQKELERENLSFDERRQVLEMLLQTQEMLSNKDTENKKFNLNVIFLTGAFFVVGLGIAASLLGANTNIRLPKKAS